MTIIRETDLTICQIDSEIPVMMHRWLRKPNSEEFREELKALQELYIEQSPGFTNLKWLADTELLGERTKDDEVWLEETWEKMLFDEAGVKVHAVILGHDIYADYSMESFLRDADRTYRDKGVQLGLFMNIESAMEWLREG